MKDNYFKCRSEYDDLFNDILCNDNCSECIRCYDCSMCIHIDDPFPFTCMHCILGYDDIDI